MCTEKLNIHIEKIQKLKHITKLKNKYKVDQTGGHHGVGQI